MTYEEFEWKLLKLVYEDGVDRLQPAFIAYALGLPHETVSSYLEHATQNGLLEMEVTDDGRIEYVVPGHEGVEAMPDPVWKEVQAEQQCADSDAPAEQLEQRAMVQSDRREAPSSGASASTAMARVVEARGPEDGASGGAQNLPARLPEDAGTKGDHSKALAKVVKRRGEQEDNSHNKLKRFPTTLRKHIEARFGGEDGSVDQVGMSTAVVARDATVSDADPVTVTGELVRADESGSSSKVPVRIETNDETFCDPSQTIFMRQMTVRGVESEAALREHVEKLFGSFGYRAVYEGDERMRFERGSVTFILALVPLFVLVLPLFVYLFLYCMGRSTIHQEPLELDVQMRKSGDDPDAYELDLTFIGMHGVVLGAADQRVLNQEVDTLEDELQWNLSTS
ncbi:MAG: hypothetical protein ACQEVA_14330 [Myxococcota bacterium]